MKRFSNKKLNDVIEEAKQPISTVIAKSGVSRTSLWHLRHSNSCPTADTLAKLASYFYQRSGSYWTQRQNGRHRTRNSAITYGWYRNFLPEGGL